MRKWLCRNGSLIWVKSLCAGTAYGPRMITLTLNPAVDVATEAEAVRPTHKIRTTNEHYDPGGGGINVARIVRKLGGEALALVLLGGVSGGLLEALLFEAGIPFRSFPIRGRSRMSLTVHERRTGLEYRFVAEGPEIRQDEWEPVLAALDEFPGDWLVASGSLPRGVPADLYAQIARRAARHGQHVVLDCAGTPLRAALGCGLTLIKPSLRELEDLLGRELRDPGTQEAEALALVHSGAAEIVALTLGAEGAIIASKAGVFHLPAPAVPVISSVGAGDSFVAGMTLGLARGASLEDAAAWGIAAGSATVSSYGTAGLTRESVEALRGALISDRISTALRQS
ncbi:MAG: 1-phosphofructokinase family hexose kinase [Acetobacteraceae bacterium]|nr:1-phosphofructokinase family hexose kinase [Acetobacteraceae bacterium]MBV8588686.1 1-phosphofructokinase family hexose kinase [Acetobacteraceae bacterium]